MLLLLTVICAVLSFFGARFGASSESAESVPSRKEITVVLDAGHGGEDGGAVSTSEIFEKDVNLEIAFLLRDLLEANGVRVVMTRETDTLLYDKNADYEGRKKVLDLAARRKIGEETENAVFISIHMNAYPDAREKGLQVWYSPHHEESVFLAKTLQSTAKLHLQPENKRQVKEATSRIYLLDRLTCPAVLVECGFLSNPEEAERLASDEYQHRLALVLFLSIMEWTYGG